MRRGSGAALFWRDLSRNLLAGSRLAFFLRVRALDFRISSAQCFALTLVCLALWFALGVAQQGVPGEVDPGALATALAAIPIALAVCVLAAGLLGQARLALGFAVVLPTSVPAFLLVDYVAELAWNRAAPAHTLILDGVIVAWAVGIALRTPLVLTGWRGRRSALALVLFAALAGALLEIAPRAQIWVATAEEDSGDSDLSLTQEEVFHEQARLLDERLAALEPERRGVPDLYFVGVAGDGGQDTFYSEVESIRELLDERFDTEDRSIELINNPGTLTEQPIATVSNLRTTLAFLGSTINTEEDIVLLHIATHGTSDYQLKFDMPPLELVQLTPSALARILAESGIKWKVIVISACFSGGYVEPLRDDNTLVITAADAFHSSFGCSYDSDYTWFSEALYDEALRDTFSLEEAFEAAKKTVAERERAEGFPPSNPQIAMGRAIRAKLAALERRLEGGPGGDQKSRVIRVRASDSRMVLVTGR